MAGEIKTEIKNALGNEGLCLYRRMLQEKTIDMHGCQHDEDGFWDATGDKGEAIFDQILDELDALKGVKTRHE